MRRALILAAALFVASCSLFESGTHVREAQLYQPGIASYDAYFKEVHELQVATASWPDQKRAARRPLVDLLKLSLDAADVTIAQATHERMIGAAHDAGATHLDLKADEPKVVAAGGEGRVDAATKDFFRAIEGSVKAELARRKALRDLPPRIDELTKVGRELEPKVRDDFAGHGGGLTSDVKAELEASYDVLSTLSANARNEAREAEDFVSVLERAISAAPSEPLPKPEGSAKGPPPKPKPTGASPPATAKPPPPVNPPPPATTNKPPPPPPPKPTGGGDEVFNP